MTLPSLRALSLTLTLALTLGLGLVASPQATSPAFASPTAPNMHPNPSPNPKHGSPHYKATDISASNKAKLARAGKMMAAINSKHQLDYKKLDKYDSGKVTERRYFAVGFWFAKGKIINISAAEKAKLRQISGDMIRHATGKNSNAKTFDKPPTYPDLFYNCTGQFKTTEFKNWGWEVWFNSCQSTQLANLYYDASSVAGAFAKWIPEPRVRLVISLSGVELRLMSHWIEFCQGYSRWNAVIVDLTINGWGWVKPQ